jgi:hypothetical protein
VRDDGTLFIGLVGLSDMYDHNEALVARARVAFSLCVMGSGCGS